MTIAVSVDWDIQNQTKQKNHNLGKVLLACGGFVSIYLFV